MHIQKKYIRSIAPVAAALAGKRSIVVSYTVQNEFRAQTMARIGFEPPYGLNACIVPCAVGPVSRFNSCGKDRVLRHLPKERFSRWRCFTDWHGNLHYTGCSAKRYQREHIPAPLEELSFIERGGGQCIVSRIIANNGENEAALAHLINLFLELFGECDILDDNLMPLIDERHLKPVCWEILPPGECPWEQLVSAIPELSTQGTLQRALRRKCFETLSRYQPSAIYVGIAGLSGYVAFEYADKGLCVLENLLYGHATYVFRGEWKEASKNSKAAIIRGSLCEHRLIHGSAWELEIAALLR